MMRWSASGSGGGNQKLPYINLNSPHLESNATSPKRPHSQSPFGLIQLVWLCLSPFIVIGMYRWGAHRYNNPVLIPSEHRQDTFACTTRPYQQSVQALCSGSDFSKVPGSGLEMGMNRLLTDEQCDIAFPNLYVEIERAINHWRAKGGITLKSLDDAIPKSQARAMIYNNRLYVKWFGDFQQGLRTKASLSSIFEAIASSPEPIPDVEFVLQTGDNGIVSGAPWALGRRNKELDLTLMPDYGFWSWPEPGVGSFLEVADKTKLYESRIAWSQKTPQLFWRGALMVDIRKRLVLLARKYKWGAVTDIDWTDNDDVTNRLLTPEEHCQYKYLAHVEGWAYSGRLKYIQQCRSVIVAHDMEYVQHYHHLFNAQDGHPEQNMVIIPGDQWTTLPKEMDKLISNDTRALEIATNSFNQWRKYLNPSATNCYWRRLFRRWASIQQFEPELFNDTVSFESFILMGRTKWTPY